MVDRRKLALIEELMAYDPGLGDVMPHPSRNPQRLSPEELLMLELAQQPQAETAPLPMNEPEPAGSDATLERPPPFMPSGNFDPTPSTPYTDADHMRNLASRTVRNVVPGTNWLLSQALGDPDTPGSTPGDLQRQYHDHDESFATEYPWQSFGADAAAVAVPAVGINASINRAVASRLPDMRLSFARAATDREKSLSGVLNSPVQMAGVGAAHGGTDEYLDNPYASAESVGSRAAAGAVGGITSALPVGEIMMRVPRLFQTMAGTRGRRPNATQREALSPPQELPREMPTSQIEGPQPPPRQPPNSATDPSQASPSPIPQEPRYTRAHSKITEDAFKQVLGATGKGFAAPTQAERSAAVSALQAAFRAAGLEVPSASNLNRRLGSTVQALVDFKRAGADITDPRVVRRAFGGPTQLAVPFAIGAAASDEEQRRALIEALSE